MPHDGHDHARHHHPKAGADNERRVLIVLALTASFMVVEVVGGLLSGSLALLADAGHMLTDTAALALSWFAFRMARRPADPQRSYGYHRLQVVAAFINGLTLIGITVWIVYEAAIRIFAPVEVNGGLMIWVAAAGLVVNIVGFMILARGDRNNLNLRSASLHILGDLLGSVATVIAGAVIIVWGWAPIDPILSVLVAGLICRNAVPLVRESAHILMEGTPTKHDIKEIARVLQEGVDDVEDIHHVHIWQLTEERPLVTLHAMVSWNADRDSALRAIKQLLKERFDLAHATVQIEAGDCPDEEAGHSHS
ncbi:MAG: cation diffusion facilitator family transporter [Alphaproteobacteria bacterium]|jgi:cobalt-zinc-cadmium efflux system protein|nr:cation transporter [Rhodospirillaceae bacterium]MBT6512964.1 cation transporter [Rhodospirillaceae bacterium]MBT7649282.1 cation transporter [Rhodospirillaceae bacterium]MDG2479700.1 cation diffusion facilitator family transporter [Alphaproteobacteria bacterium]